MPHSIVIASPLAELFPMVKFTLNSSVSASTGYAPFELNYRYIPQLGQRLHTNTMFVGVKQFTQQVLWNAMTAHDAIIASRVMQTHQANHQRWAGETYLPGNRLYLSTKNLALPKGRAKKLLPKFIGPYKIVEAHTATSTLWHWSSPPELTAQWVHPTFHMNLIRALTTIY